MDLAVFIKETLRTLLLPPGSLLLIMAVCLALPARWARPARLGLISAVLGLYALSTPLVAQSLFRLVEPPALIKNLAGMDQAQAIVILGGGKRFAAPDVVEGETINNVTLARVRYGARIAKVSGLPVLVSGGAPLGGASEAHYMRQALHEYGVDVRWVEGGSVDTTENAALSAQLLGPQIRQIILVTSADHMPRAARSFRQQGFEVFTAPTDYPNREPFNLTALLPKASALQLSSTAFRELLGQLWYALRGQ
ncbi:YdcF family protein [Chitinibacter tainanensis]|uniref:YdcF family protein n=1 Tax=Chitinibacter tainanensis TaxID=230667 RepID=UPI0003F53B78|nr:YdcF family protein [Chitinibacter tainanensis]